MSDRKKIVILDDDEIFGALLAEMLGEYYDVQIGHNGLEGIELCLQGGVDAVITDIGMPELDGVQMLSKFHSNPRLSSIPALVVTATHFTRISRSEVERFPQVRGMFSKSEKAEVIVEAVRKALQGG